MSLLVSEGLLKVFFLREGQNLCPCLWAYSGSQEKSSSCMNQKHTFWKCLAGLEVVEEHQTKCFCAYDLGQQTRLSPDCWLWALCLSACNSEVIMLNCLSSTPPVLQPLLYAFYRELHEWVHGTHQRPLWSKGGGLPAWRGQLAQHDDSSRARCWLFWEGEQSQAGAWEGCRRDYGKEPREPVRFCTQHSMLPLPKYSLPSCRKAGKSLHQTAAAFTPHTHQRCSAPRSSSGDTRCQAALIICPHK